MNTNVDVVIVGGGPAGLSAALALGRARRRVLLADAGPRRNAAATHVHNFLTRDGTPPDELRKVAREQLAAYPNVSVVDEAVAAVGGARGSFSCSFSSGSVVHARRVVVCTGLVDELLPIEGFRDFWGRGVFQCPYCHGWEHQDRPWGLLARDPAHLVPFALMLKGWSDDVTAFIHGATVTEEQQQQLTRSGVKIERERVARLIGDAQLRSIELADGRRAPMHALFAHPPQKHVELVRALGLALDDDGFVKVDAMRRETSVPGIYAGGDLTTRGQAAILAAAAGMQAAAAVNVDLAMEIL